MFVSFSLSSLSLFPVIFLLVFVADELIADVEDVDMVGLLLFQVGRQINGGGLRMGRKSPQQQHLASAHLLVLATTSKALLAAVPAVPLPVPPLLSPLPQAMPLITTTPPITTNSDWVLPEAAAAAAEAARAAAAACSNSNSSSSSSSSSSSGAAMDIDTNSSSSSSSSSSRCSIEGLTMCQSLSYLSDVCDMLYKLHIDDKNRGLLMTLTFDLFHKVTKQQQPHPFHLLLLLLLL